MTDDPRRDGEHVTEIRRHLRALAPSVRKRRTAQLLARSLKLYDAMTEFIERLDPWISASDQELRRRMGELSAQELRAVRAILGIIEQIGEEAFGAHNTPDQQTAAQEKPS